MFPLTSQCQIRPITLKPTNETVLLPNLKKLVELPPFWTCSSEIRCVHHSTIPGKANYHEKCSFT